MTNLDAKLAATMLPEAFVNERRLVVMGAEEIGASVDRHHAVRATLPSVLGLRDLGSLIDPGIRTRSSLDVASVGELARVFWPTRAYERARTVLGNHGFVVLTGPPEMGKTAIAQMLALAQMADGWEAYECTDPNQVWQAFDPSRRQVFVADDAFGSTEYRPDAAERWALGLGRLLTMLDADHWLIWTSRPAPLKAGLRRVQRERGSERFPDPGEVLVDASDLDLQEKTLILFRHAKACGPSQPARNLLTSAGEVIVEHPHFTPERIRRFISGNLKQLPNLTGGNLPRLAEMVERELASPTDAMRNSFNALEREHRALLVSLLDAPAGLIDERELAATVRRHHPGGLSRPPGELIDRLTDHFLRVTPLGIGWVHPSWRDLVIDQLRADPPARRRFLAVCELHGVMLALSQQGGRSGERRLPLLENDADWDQLGDRLSELLRQIEATDLSRLLLALGTAITDSSDPRQFREAQSLAIQVLETTQRTWDQAHQPVPTFLLEAWYRLRNHALRRIDAPQLTTTWVELHPGTSLLQDCNREELIRADEWLTVAQILHEHEPATLEAFGFYDRDSEFLERLIATLAQRIALHDDIRPLRESVLTRIEDIVPDLAATARSVLTIAGLAERLEDRRWWIPEDIAAPPSTERLDRATDFTRHDVTRVLNDL